MKPICVKCKLFFRPKQNGVAFEEGMPVGKAWAPYKLWSGDLWECRGCGAEIIAGTGLAHIAEHFEPDYAEQVTRFAPAFRVDDC